MQRRGRAQELGSPRTRRCSWPQTDTGWGAFWEPALEGPRKQAEANKSTLRKTASLQPGSTFPHWQTRISWSSEVCSPRGWQGASGQGAPGRQQQEGPSQGQPFAGFFIGGPTNGTVLSDLGTYFCILNTLQQRSQLTQVCKASPLSLSRLQARSPRFLTCPVILGLRFLIQQMGMPDGPAASDRLHSHPGASGVCPQALRPGAACVLAVTVTVLCTV